MSGARPLPRMRPCWVSLQARPRVPHGGVTSLLSLPRKPAWKDGSTATCVLAVDNVLYIANLGDSRVCGQHAHPDTSAPWGRGRRRLGRDGTLRAGAAALWEDAGCGLSVWEPDTLSSAGRPARHGPWLAAPRQGSRRSRLERVVGSDGALPRHTSDLRALLPGVTLLPERLDLGSQGRVHAMCPPPPTGSLGVSRGDSWSLSCHCGGNNFELEVGPPQGGLSPAAVGS